MLAGELRYAAVWLWIVSVFLVPVALVVVLGKLVHAPDTMLAAVAALLICAFGFASVWLWLRFRRPALSAAPAGFARIVFPSLILLVSVYLIVINAQALQAMHWRRGVEPFCLLCICTLWLAVSTIQGWRRRYLDLPATVPAYTQRRIKQLAEAYAAPPGPERRRALRPLHLSGYVRLGLLVVTVVLVLVLAPTIGTLPAWLLTSATVMSVFFVFHRRFEQF